tara:strand:+ start:234 stop:431 length:198 start_codon:yes stop_codon:yes gene_type:complete
MKNKKQVQHMLNRYEDDEIGPENAVTEPFVLALEWVLEITSDKQVDIEMLDRTWKVFGRNRPDNE